MGWCGGCAFSRRFKCVVGARDVGNNLDVAVAVDRVEESSWAVVGKVVEVKV